MSTPQRSRYPRPLKATHTFQSGSAGAGQTQGVPAGQLASASGSPSPSTGSSTTAAVPGVGQTTGAAALKNGHSSPPPVPGNGVRRCASSPEWKSPVAGNRGEGVGEDQKVGHAGLNPRRSNSLGSLSEPDCYMNALWPRLATVSIQTTTQQGDSEEPLSSSDTECIFFTHKRSNSCSSDDRLKVNKPGSLKNGLAPSAHTRRSVEGLNQEVSSVLAGNPILIVENAHPDGHVAPVQDLLVSATVGTQTPPSLGNGSGVISSSQTPSPFHPPSSSSSPAALPSTHTPTTSDPSHSGTNGYNREYSREESPASLQHPPSPKPSFAREPPDGAERCTIKVETSMHLEGFVPSGPDKSKGTIVFKGTAFAPPPPAFQPLQAVP